MRFTCLPLLVVMSIVTPLIASPTSPTEPTRARASMQIYASKYYVIHTDLDPDEVKEAIIRMNHMAEEYHARTQGFSGEIHERLPFFLFRTEEEYYQAGGLPGTAGVFMVDQNGARLMAVAGEKTNRNTWHVVQHEGFHQFAHAVIRGELPAWVNEGIAEYFGESVFTGDAFVTGVIPPSRLQRVQAEIKSGRLKPLKDMMLTSQQRWNMEMQIENYDQAWSMVHFLAQGDNGRYQDAFVAFMKLIGHGIQWQMAWKQTFGDTAGFEEKWKQYWLNLPENPTSDLYAQAITGIFDSFLSRAATQKQTFASFDQFLSAAKEGNIKVGQTIEDWLPPKLLETAVKSAEGAPLKWTLEPGLNKTSQIVTDLEDGTRLIGSYAIVSGHATRVIVDVDDTATVMKQAQSLLDSGKKEQARTMLQAALRSHPKSPMIEQVRKMILATR